MSGITVLSLFDGIACGAQALKNAGVDVKIYYASEINTDAMKIAWKNHPEIIELGDVRAWKHWKINWSEIDLLIGGSPCQGFSQAGRKAGLDDERSGLFFEYLNILNRIQSVNPAVKFLLENVKMNPIEEKLISGYLRTRPVLINSSLVSAQNRERLYWANWEIRPPKDKKIPFARILDGATTDKEKCPCILTRIDRHNKNTKENEREKPFKVKAETGEMRYLTPEECEEAQTLPVGYTEGIPKSKRYECIGNGWTIAVITYLFQQMNGKTVRQANFGVVLKNG
ncbi:DNA cytosine methyltransferase [Methanolapillus millepedarum]|uniref:DNA (cytosine-5-)-methyltransferase n=1 Tax=Methanolapillus millepedarum TaxID=3028296 RepID=A0AA96VAZ8_9EURY|nr:hypothetical protein MsAc7_03210 [Methanosarcinaceae archaeon Ac7]